jgi:hypothetical protein
MDCLEDFVLVLWGVVTDTSIINARVFLKGLFGMKVVRKVNWLNLGHWNLLAGQRLRHLVVGLLSLSERGGCHGPDCVLLV